MLTDEQRGRLWRELLDADFRARYYASSVCRYETLDHGTRLLILLGSSAVLVALLQGLDPVWPKLVSAFVASCSLISFLMGWSKKADRCADLHARFSRLANAYTDLWDGQNEPEAMATWRALREESVGHCNIATRLHVWGSLAKAAQKESLRARSLRLVS